jgi:hypothetical protein
MKKLLSTIGIILLTINFCIGQTIAKDNIENEKGKTKAKGSYSLKKDGDNLKLSMRFSVKKNGQSGNGKGVYALVIFDDNFEPVFKFEKGFTVGAKVPEGTNKKRWKKNVTITGEKAKKMEKDGIILAFNVGVSYDKLGIPTSLDEWKDAIKEGLTFSNEIMELTVGESMKRGDWKFVKLLATGN